MSRCKPYEKVIQLLPGPIGPIGPRGPDTVAPITRSLKVQLVEGELTVIINEGFDYESEVAEPAAWPLPGTFTFYRATVIDEPQFNYSELLNVAGTASHTDVMVQQQAAIAHYRDGTLIDIHWASSFIAEDSIDALVTQNLADVLVADELYFAITPSTASIGSFNYNISSVRCVPTFMIPADLPIDLPNPSAGLLAGPFKAVVTDPVDVTLQLMSAGGGGGSGGPSESDEFSSVIGGGGGGGGSGGMFATDVGMTLSLVAGDTFDWQIGVGGAGGVTEQAGQDGGDSQIKLNGTLLSGATFTGMNPTPGGDGGKTGSLYAGGDGGASLAGGEGGGGGGAALVNGVATDNGVGMDGGMDGGFAPRDGGEGGNGNPGGTGGDLGAVGSGGGGGGGFLLGAGGEGGNGGAEEGNDGSAGANAFIANGGGGGGSGAKAAADESTAGGRGGIGGCGSIKIEMA